MRWAPLLEGSGQRRWLPWALGLFGPVAVAACWIPARDHLPNVNAALLMVAIVALTGLLGRRLPVVFASVSAAMAFDFFATAPYGTLAIARGRDLVTTVVLAIVGAGCGELAVRVQRARWDSKTRSDAFSRVRDAAALVAEGEEPVLILGSVAEELSRLLGLRDCWYEVDAEAAVHEVARDGSIGQTPLRRPRGESSMQPGTPRPSGRWDQLALPVWSGGRRIGAFRLVVTPGVPMESERLRVAFTLADQAGAALAAFEAPSQSTGHNVSQDRDASQHRDDAAPAPANLRLLH